MSVRLFCSTNESTWAENKFFADLFDRFKNSNFDVSILTDLNIEGKQLDCVVLSSKGAFIYEHKNYTGKVVGSENGEWTLQKPDGDSVIINRNRNNPFQQTRDQRFSLMNFLNKHFNKIFPTSSKGVIDTSHIGGRLVFTHANTESLFDISDKANRWFKVINPEDILEDYRLAPTGLLTLKRENIENLVQILNLKEVLDSSSVQNDTDQFCPICAYESQSTECVSVKGIVKSVEGRTITVSDGEHLHTLYDARGEGNDEDLVDLSRLGVEIKPNILEHNLIGAISEKFTNTLNNHPLQINLMHLKMIDNQFTITADSLVILLPAWTISVTSFTQLDFCKRQAITSNYALAPSNKYIHRGVAVNKGFEALVESEPKLEHALDAAKAELNNAKVEFITSGANPVEISSQIESELETLNEWRQERELEGKPRTEAFLISTELGLKGKLDLVLEDEESGEITDIIELKSSKPDWRTGDVKDFHAIQAGAYALLTIMKQQKPLDLSDISVLYSQSLSHPEKKVDITKELFVRICHYRNLLLYAEFFDTLPDHSHPMHTPNGCKACGQKEICMDLCRVTQFDHCTSTCFKHPENFQAPINCKMNSDHSSLHLERFDEWRHFLKYQKLYNYSGYADVLKMPEELAVELGKLLPVHHRTTEEQVPGRYVYSFEFRENTSEFRKHDIVLLSENRDVSNSSVTVGSMLDINRHGCRVQLNEKVNFNPRYIYPYHIDRGDNIGLIGLYNGHFSDIPVSDRIYGSNYDNIELIHGPPGSGKTTTIVESLRRHAEAGERVIVCALTNRAIEEVYKGLELKGLLDVIYRFGSTSRLEEIGDQLFSPFEDVDGLSTEIQNKMIWLGTLHSAANEWLKNLPFEFDYAYMDEASQITTPQSMFPLSLAKKWVLVGDHHQLPPIFPSRNGDETALDPPGESIFVQMLEHLQNADIAPRPLNIQYRMNPQIFEYSRNKWYPEQQSAPKASEKWLEYVDEGWKNDELSEILTPENPTLWVDVKVEKLDSNKRNLEESIAVAAIVKKMINFGIEASDIGIMAPFRMQVNTIKNALEAELEDLTSLDGELLIDTVDRFQGTQRKVILISMCAINPEENIMLDGQMRRFNVALTRAECKRIILGNVQSYKESKIQDLFDDGFTNVINMD